MIFRNVHFCHLLFIAVETYGNDLAFYSFPGSLILTGGGSEITAQLKGQRNRPRDSYWGSVEKTTHLSASDGPRWGLFKVPVQGAVHSLRWNREEGGSRENLPDQDPRGHACTKSSTHSALKPGCTWEPSF